MPSAKRWCSSAGRWLPLLLSALLILSGCGGGQASAPQTTAVPAPAASAPAASIPDSPAAPGTVPSAPEEGRTLVVFFSRTGHTRPLAEYIASAMNAECYEIQAEIPYTDEDIQYYTDCRADREQKDPAARPAIAGAMPDLTAYDTVFLGYPIWHGQAPRIIATFLESVHLEGKRVIPFCTSASSPLGSSAEALQPLAPEARWEEGCRFAIGTTEEEILDWLTRSGWLSRGKKEESSLRLFVNDTQISVLWEEGETLEALKALVREEQPLQIRMSPYGGFEQVGPLGRSLPRSDRRITTQPGDIMLYSGDQIVLFHGANTWAYTPLGRISGLSPEELTALLGSGAVTLRLSFD